MPSSAAPYETTTRSARKKRPGGRSSFNRIYHIHRLMSEGARTNANLLARELETSPRTIKRDIETLRDFHGAPLVWDSSNNTYYYSRPCPFLPLLRLSADEALALVLAGNTFAAWKGSSLGRALFGALGKVAEVAGDSVSLPADEIDRLLSNHENGAETETEQRLFAPVLECIQRRTAIQLRYKKPGARRPEARLVHPLHLAFLDHRWALVAFDVAKNGLRNFLLARMAEIEPTEERFIKPPGFDARAYLAGSFGLFTGKETYQVRIAFDAFAAPYIKERRWHPSQTIEEKQDGRIEVRLVLNHLIDVQRWILSWGSHAEALAPDKLRETIAAEVAKLSGHYKVVP